MECGKHVDPDDDTSPLCDGEHSCEDCFAESANHWMRVFGLRPDMTRQAAKNQLEQFREDSCVAMALIGRELDS